MAAQAKKHKKKSKAKHNITKKVFEEVERKPQVKLYANVDDNGSFDPPFELKERMETIDTMWDNGDIDEQDMAVYDTVQALLATPVALFMDKFAEILDDIISRGVQNSIDSIEDKEDNFDKEESEFMYKNNTASDKDKTVADNVETSDIPMSEKELDEWYRSVTGVIEGFFTASHKDKYALMQKFLKEKEIENRDLTDEELFAELEGPEQSD